MPSSAKPKIPFINASSNPKVEQGAAGGGPELSFFIERKLALLVPLQGKSIWKGGHSLSEARKARNTTRKWKSAFARALDELHKTDA